MINALKDLDHKSAIGILARMALSLDATGNPGANAILSGEETLRSLVLTEARQHLGIQPDDTHPETMEKIADYLDQESDALDPGNDASSALKRLAERGDLPSDLYEISIVKNIADFHGKNFVLEKRLIETTIRFPTKEQHFGPMRANVREPTLISLFARQFRTKFPFKDFTMLVAASRNGLLLDVLQAWRIYPSMLKTDGADNLVDLLRAFSDTYGSDVTIEGKSGHFFLLLDRVAPPMIEFVMPHGKKKTITFSQFGQTNPSNGEQGAALVVAIDLEQYKDMLNRMRSDVLDLPSVDSPAHTQAT